MQKNRLARLASVIQQEVSTVVSREVNDPRIPAVTFTHVDVVMDGSQATLSVMILGGKKSEKQMADCLEGLKSSAGFLRRHLAKILTIRHIPNLLFREDIGLDNVLRVNELLKEIGVPDSNLSPGAEAKAAAAGFDADADADGDEDSDSGESPSPDGDAEFPAKP